MELSPFATDDPEDDAAGVVVPPASSTEKEPVALSAQARAVDPQEEAPFSGGKPRGGDNHEEKVGVAPVVEDGIVWETIPNAAFDEIVARVM
jgi:hypothetical protein